MVLLSISGLVLVLYGLGVPRAWCQTPWRLSLYTYDGLAAVEWYGVKTFTKPAPTGAGLGHRTGYGTGFSSSTGLFVETHDHWLWSWQQVRTKLVVGNRSITTLQVHLARVLLLTGPLGCGLLLMRFRKPRPGECPSCRYDLAGLGSDVPCPECGAIPVHSVRDVAR